MVNPEFWRGRRVFITGHTGFKGSWLSLWLQRLGANVAGFALPPPTEPSLFEEAMVAEGMDSITGDVRDFDNLSGCLRAHAPDIVFHLAAQSVVRQSYDDPLETYSTNVMGTANLLQAARQLNGHTVVVNVTSDKCYENKEWIWAYREIDRLGGHDPYSNSKACAELVADAFVASFFDVTDGDKASTKVASARAGNVIGGGDWTRDQLIPDVIRAFQEKRKVVLRNPQAIRPWQFVLDCLCGYVTLAEAISEGRVDHHGGWNFGPEIGDARPVAWIVEALAGHLPGAEGWELEKGHQPHEANFLRLDASKAKMHLGWSQALGLEEALAWVGRWYTARQARVHVRDITLAQIDEFQKRVLSSEV